MANPFDHQNPAAPEDFLDRESDRKELARWIESGRNLLVLGARRRGKTSLIRRALADLPPGITGLLVDVYGCNGQADVAQRILDAFGATGLARSRRFSKWLGDAVRSIDEVEASLSKGGATVRLHRGRPPGDSLAAAWRFLERAMEDLDHRLVLALDEFQDIIPIPGLTKDLRRLNQASPRLQLLLSGSVTATLRALQEDRASPFYQQLTLKAVRGLTIHDLRTDADDRLPRPLTDAQVAAIDAFCGDDTRRVVQVLRHHHELGDVDGAVAATLWENRTEYELILKAVKHGNQRRVLYALAKDQPEHPTGNAFLIEHRLGAPQNVRNAIKALQELEVLDEDGRTFLDPTFRTHLVRQQSA